MSLLQMSLSGAALTAAVVIIRVLFMHKIPKGVFSCLWAIVVLRLIIPAALPSPFSVYSIAQKVEMDMKIQNAESGKGMQDTAEEMAAQDRVLKDVSADGAEVPGGIDILQQEKVPEIYRKVSASEKDQTEEQALTGNRAIPVWSVIWVAGMILCSLYFGVSYVRCLREFAASFPVSEPYAGKWLHTHSLRRKISIRQTGLVSAPLTYGIVSPVILVPKNLNWEDEKLPLILEHEYIHIRRFDTITKLFYTAALCIHWFNPLVWVMFVLANRDLELSCDEQVIRSFGYSVRASYARTLIRMEESKSTFIPLGSSFGKCAIEERIVAIMKYKKVSVLAGAIAAVLMVSTTAVFATSAVSEEKAGTEENNTAVNVLEQDPDTEGIGGVGVSFTQNERFPEYEKFGLSYDEKTDRLMYEGKTVGIFQDEFEPDTYTHISSTGGILRVEVQRENYGAVTGMKAETLPKGFWDGLQGRETTETMLAESQSHGVTEIMPRELQSADAAKDTVSAGITFQKSDADGSYEAETYYEQDQELTAEYGAWGIDRDETYGIWIYKGQPVKLLLESTGAVYMNGGSYENGKFSADDSSGIFLYLIRDKEGEIASLSEVTEETMEALLSSAGFDDSGESGGMPADIQQIEEDYTEENIAEHIGTGTDGTSMISFVSEIDGKTYYSWDDGYTFTPLTDEQYSEIFPVQDIQWWTYEEYAAWLEEERAELPKIIGERGWTASEGEFVWTREMVDQTIARYEKTLQEIKDGYRISKSVDGDADVQIIMSPAEDISQVREYECSIELTNGAEAHIGPYDTKEEMLETLESYCEEQVRMGNLSQSDADAMLSKYRG